VVRLLLEKGADVKATGGYYGNALQAASAGGHEAVVRLLLDKGADVKVPDQIGRTSLLRVAEKGNVAMVSLLVTARIDLPQHSKDSQSLLRQVVTNELATVVETMRTKDKGQLNSYTLEHGYYGLRSERTTLRKDDRSRIECEMHTNCIQNGKFTSWNDVKPSTAGLRRRRRQPNTWSPYTRDSDSRILQMGS
jgi:ankyrin repeat protein